MIFLYQAEDGIRDLTVTGVQTCALPISRRHGQVRLGRGVVSVASAAAGERLEVPRREIGRASCRERVCSRKGGRPKANQTAKKFRDGIRSNISTYRKNLISGVDRCILQH